MPASAIAGYGDVLIAVENPNSDDFGGLRVWMSTVNGFTAGPGNLVYDGQDLNYRAQGLLPGTPYYFRLALYSQIDPTDYELSAQYTATPLLVPDAAIAAVSADKVSPGELRDSHAVAGTVSTKGTKLTAAVAAAATVLPVKSTVDFPSSGAGWVLSSIDANDRDRFSYTGKTGASLTGVTGLNAHALGDIVIPAGKTIVLDSGLGEIRIFGDRGDGTLEQLVALGVTGSSDKVLLRMGHEQGTVTPLTAECGPGGYAAGAFTHYGDGPAVLANSSGGIGVDAQTGSTTSPAVSARNSNTGPALVASQDGTGGRSLELYNSSGVHAPLHIQPYAVAPANGLGSAGDTYMSSGGRLGVHDGAAFRLAVFDEVVSSWTPTLEGTTTAGVGTYTSQLKSFVKYGKRFMGELTLTWTGHTGAGNMQIAGLPFVNAGSASPVTVYLSGITITAGNSVYAQIAAGASVISLIQATPAGTVSGIPMDTAGTIRINFSYEA